MVKATWQGKTIAESEETVIVEGNHYFPPSSIDRQFFKDSNTQSTCPWKGEASYYSVAVEGQENTDAAWYYPNPKPEAANIKDHVAFWKGVQVG